MGPAVQRLRNDERRAEKGGQRKKPAEAERGPAVELQPQASQSKAQHSRWRSYSMGCWLAPAEGRRWLGGGERGVMLADARRGLDPARQLGRLADVAGRRHGQQAVFLGLRDLQRADQPVQR